MLKCCDMKTVCGWWFFLCLGQVLAGQFDEVISERDADNHRDRVRADHFCIMTRVEVGQALSADSLVVAKEALRRAVVSRDGAIAAAVAICDRAGDATVANLHAALATSAVASAIAHVEAYTAAVFPSGASASAARARVACASAARAKLACDAAARQYLIRSASARAVNADLPDWGLVAVYLAKVARVYVTSAAVAAASAATQAAAVVASPDAARIATATAITAFERLSLASAAATAASTTADALAASINNARAARIIAADLTGVARIVSAARSAATAATIAASVAVSAAASATANVEAAGDEADAAFVLVYESYAASMGFAHAARQGSDPALVARTTVDANAAFCMLYVADAHTAVAHAAAIRAAAVVSPTVAHAVDVHAEARRVVAARAALVDFVARARQASQAEIIHIAEAALVTLDRLGTMVTAHAAIVDATCAM